MINKIERKYQTKLNFAQIMGACFCICKLQCNRISFSGRKQYCLKTLKQPENVIFLFKNLSSAVISLGLLVMQTLYVTNVFFFLIKQYFSDTIENILKLFQGFSSTLLYPLLYHVHTFWFGY